MSKDRVAILELIERETLAFLSRDFEAWADCWLHDECVRRLGALMGGLMEYQEGWATGSDAVRHFFSQFPEPNPEAANSMRRSNISVRVSGDMAWVSFDQYGEKSVDPLVTVGLSHQIRILENVGGQWKIAMAGHGDTSLEYFDFPAVRIDNRCRIEWMNDAAQEELTIHPALTKSGVYLRGRYRDDDKALRTAVVEVSGRSVMERRPSLQNPQGQMADPVILTGGSADEQHIVWVSAQDGMLLVSFRDRKNERARLRKAADLYQLSPAQTRIAELLLEGLSLQDIAERLGIRESTTKTHLARVFDKSGARSQPALVAKLLGIGPPR